MKKYTYEIVLFTLAILIIVFSLLKEETTRNEKMEDEEITPIPEPEPVFVWGFPLDAIEIDTLRVQRNQSLSDILLPKGISAYSIDRLAKASKEVFNVRSIKAGNTYYLIRRDTTGIPGALVYEASITDYVVFHLDSALVETGTKPVDSVLQHTGGIIETSLWDAFVSNGSSPVLAVELSDIFAWTIDFFGIQRGDQFKVIYDALYVEGQYAGIGKIHAASFVHMGSPVSAYYYHGNGQEGYFDDEGNSLRKAFLKAPLKFSRISSRFSHSRFHPVLKIRRPHHGVDYAAPAGTPVYSIGDGTVVKKGFQRRGGGNYINIKHNSVYTSQYMHLKGFAKGMATGTRVKQGQLIGYVGSTGLSTGPHLDFRVFKNGSPVDPLRIEAPPVEPINETNQLPFMALRDSIKLQLDQISTMPQPDPVTEQSVTSQAN
ncbi:M23 family metallopeptidase [Roseimarinus sediminis]|uniref:M23 family metallopeptidase n=1 Tax=Roseimarinus sediminis TaxID=1610899 RepID=UPI003D1ED51F